jgi:hypothetical protein
MLENSEILKVKKAGLMTRENTTSAPLLCFYFRAKSDLKTQRNIRSGEIQADRTLVTFSLSQLHYCSSTPFFLRVRSETYPCISNPNPHILDVLLYTGLASRHVAELVYAI